MRKPRVREMRKLSPAYHLVAAEQVPEGTRLTCRDLRTRNFGGRFGTLEITVDIQGNPMEKMLHV